MTTQEINQGVNLLCTTSKEIQNCWESLQSLVDSINDAKREDIIKCWNYYKDKNGVVINVRKELFELLKDGIIITVDILENLVTKHKNGKENQFRSYKNYYSIFYPAITFYGHNPHRKFVDDFKNQFIKDLGLDNIVKTTSFDFQGSRQHGSDRYWMAIYNKAQVNQSTGLQFFIDFHHGKMSYGIYQHGNRNYVKENKVVTPDSFNYQEMLDYFKSDIQLIIDDVPKQEQETVINLNNNHLYKVSIGFFKAKKDKKIIDTVIENNWVIVHENTGKDQANLFKDTIKTGDYIYVNIGSEQLIGIAKITSDEWDYVPTEITGNDGWMFREIEIISHPIKQNVKQLKDKSFIFPSGNSTVTEIKPDKLQEANEKLFKPYFNVSFNQSDMETSPLNNDNKYKPSLNQILYGPPGTGKTYNTILEAAKIITGDEKIGFDEALDVFNTNLHNQIEFITFHQNYSYEDFIQGLRPDTENGNALTFDKKDGVFKRIADRALKNLTASNNPESVKKEFKDVFNELIQPLNNEEVNEIEIRMKKSSYFITEVGEKSIAFRKNIGDSEHTLSINSLHKMYDKGENDFILGGLQPYYNPLLQLLLDKGKSTVTAVTKNNYVIIIDEINRANISRVFGELITLIEEDKRSHGKIPMTVTLPSGDPFTVPSNLYIIGTMNTADKSIALLDIALRRRFEFVPMYPKYSGLEKPVNDDAILFKINEAIIKRKGHDFTIGHSYFMGENYSLEKTINHKVIPLLLEYFMNDEKEVTNLLKDAGITIGEWPLKMIS